MSRIWADDATEEQKRRRLLELIERGEAEVAQTKDAMEAASKKAKPYEERARQASRLHYSVRDQLLDDRAELAALLHDDERPDLHTFPVKR